MNRRLFIITFVFLFGVVSAMSFHYFYNKYEWEIHENQGYVLDGSADAYDSMYFLRINGWTFYGSNYRIVDNGRGIWIEGTYGNLRIIRYIYVPPYPEMWARFVDYVKNEGASTVTVEIQVYGNLGSDGWTKIWGTSNGDTVMESTDVWFGTDDWDNGGDPSLVHWMGYNLYSAMRSYDNLYFTWRITLEPGESATIIYWAIQAPNQATARELAQDILQKIQNGETDSKYFERLVDDPDKEFLLENVINMPDWLFVSKPKLKIYKRVNKTELFTWEELGVKLVVNITWPSKVNESVKYSFEKITIEDSFPTKFDFIGTVEDNVREIGVSIVKMWENGTVVLNKTYYVPISIEGDCYKFVLEPKDELEGVLKIVPNQTLEIGYIIIPKFAGEYTLPAAVMSYLLNETIVG